MTLAIFTKIMNQPNAKEMWDFLKKEYKGDDRIKGMEVLNFLRDFERQHMKANESVKEYVDRLVEIVNQIRILGTDVDDTKIVQKVMVSVPERFEATLASLDNTKNLAELKLSEVLSALQAQEQRRIMRKEEATEGALKATVKENYVGKGKQKQKPTSGNQNKQEGNSDEANAGRNFSEPCKHCNKVNHPHWSCWRNPNVKCRHCGKLGHIERFCRSKTQRLAEAKVAETGDDENLLVASCFML
ncbi:PREDICTED: uncharacterized protein LOC104825283 [Tarenaya hassleriana]|uniref:uncharacterized protein LOC104825283 n=1 Tax=Tarenaya hassleriana TaxID=28532 RepID=UPI00053C7CE8|nr:PREDICTED: uncharacterized protein LOC104825283 [Tarenaya hassleriana]